MYKSKRIFTFDLNIDGEKKDILEAEFSDLAKRADGSVMLRAGGTTILVTAVLGKEDRKGIDFFPLNVEYEERFYATGKILGSRFTRREGRPSDEAILSARMIDRSIRPLFDERIRKDVQVVVTVLSIGKYDPDFLSVIGSSLAISTSKIPWNGPVSSVKILIPSNKKPIFYPTRSKADTEVNPLGFMILSGKKGDLNMIEVKANEIAEEDLTNILSEAQKEIDKVSKWQEDVITQITKEISLSKIQNEYIDLDEKERNIFLKEILPKIESNLFKNTTKTDEYVDEVEKEWLKFLDKDKADVGKRYFNQKIGDYIKKEAIENGKRLDGRSPDDIRPILVRGGEIGEVVHGSGMFWRGDTHVMSVLTLGSMKDSQLINDVEFTGEKRYLHHYNFPPFSTGETGKTGQTNRRMIGHGTLAEKALLPVLPDKKDFPYTIRIVSEVFSSNGSTSMASVCGSTIALLDGGVPIKSPVAGISIGIMMRENKGLINKAFGDFGHESRASSSSKYEYKLLTDIQGKEDHYGNMDFKVAGTENGITAIQMDIKSDGIPVSILFQALNKAKTARLKILEIIKKEILATKKQLSPNAPKIKSIYLNKDLIGLLIGPGGKNINSIIKNTGVDDIYIGEEEGQSVIVYIISKNITSIENAEKMIFESVK